jgi:hypothetical protein
MKNGRFADANPTAGQDFERKAVHRGAAFGDLDNDGRIDAVVTALNGPLEVWKNVSPASNHWLRVRLVGTKNNRDGAGARIKIVTASGARYDHANTAVGYGCSSDIRVHFGLGRETSVKELQITWPSGNKQVLSDLAADQDLTIKEN